MTIYLVVHEAIGCGCGGCACPDLMERHIVGAFASLEHAHRAVLSSTPACPGTHWQREYQASTPYEDGREVTRSLRLPPRGRNPRLDPARLA